MKNRRWISAAVLAVVAIPVMVPLAAARVDYTPGSAGIGDPYVPKEGNGGYQVQRYAIDLRFNPATDRLTATTVIHAKASQNLSRMNFDLYGLKVTAVEVDGVAETFIRRSRDGVTRELVVTPATGIDRGDRFVVSVDYQGKPEILNDPDLGRSGWFNTSDGAVVVGEPEAGMFWFPANEHPSDKARIKVTATVPEGLTAVSNGLPAAPPSTVGGWTTFTWSSRDPMATYLATVTIGEYRRHSSTTKSGVKVLNYIDTSFPKSVDESLGRAKEMINYFERNFGKYPFEASGGIADDHTSWYALENQTRPTYDEGTVGWSGLERTIAHELAHQWYGDSVALDRWQDIWLNEGFATYLEWMWRAHDGGPSVAAQFNDSYSLKASRPFWDLQVNDPGYANLFAWPIYDRGAMTLHALRLKVGDRDFFAIMRQWARDHRNGNGTTPQFKALAEDVSGRSLGKLFDDWLVDRDKPADPRR